MEEELYTGTVADIDEYIIGCKFPLDAFVLVEQIPKHILTSTEERQNLLCFIRLGELSRLDELVHIGDYTSGRIFNADFELRWEKGRQTTDVVYLGTSIGRDLTWLRKDNTISLHHFRSQNYYLFGERLSERNIRNIGKPAMEGDFAEVRIPRLLRYPAPPHAQRVQLVVREYVDEETGTILLFRFCDLQAGEVA